MKNRNLRLTYKVVLFSCVASVLGWQELNAQTQSPQTEVVGNKSYIIHQVQPKETYYQLSRIYGLPVNDIMQANGKKNLKVGDSVRIPSRETATLTVQTTIQTTTNPSPNASTANENAEPNKILTEYNVGASETMYSIARRFGVSVDDLKKFNNLASDLVREGQTLKIPDGPLPTPQPLVSNEPEPTFLPAERPKTISAEDFKANQYGIREKSEKGVGVWMENLETKNNTNLALHRTAPVGTILKITNPITNSVTYAKVVGKFADNSETKDAIVVLSRSAAKFVGANDKRFVVEIAYGLPAGLE